MKTIALTKGAVALVDDEDFELLNKFKWHLTAYGYAGRRVAKRVFLYMHREILGISGQSHLDTDHINHNRLNNSRSNLRVCTRAQNLVNRKTRKDCGSGFKGVRPCGLKWAARIRQAGHEFHLGVWEDKEEAARAYNEAAFALFGEFAWLNNV